MSFELRESKYGFQWGSALVERTCSESTGRQKFQILRVYTPNGEVVEILMRPRSTKVKVFRPDDSTEFDE